MLHLTKLVQVVQFFSCNSHTFPPPLSQSVIFQSHLQTRKYSGKNALPTQLRMQFLVLLKQFLCCSSNFFLFLKQIFLLLKQLFCSSSNFLLLKHFLVLLKQHKKLLDQYKSFIEQLCCSIVLHEKIASVRGRACVFSGEAKILVRGEASVKIIKKI